MTRMIEIPTTKGMMKVPATNATEEIPHLVVTMTTFGIFEVTHTKSGFRIVGNFERAINAFIAMAELQLAFNELGIDASQDSEEFREAIKSKDKLCESLGMTIQQWLALHATVGNFSGEFPWEGGDDCPHYKFEKLIGKLKAPSATRD